MKVNILHAHTAVPHTRSEIGGLGLRGVGEGAVLIPHGTEVVVDQRGVVLLLAQQQLHLCRPLIALACTCVRQCVTWHVDNRTCAT